MLLLFLLIPLIVFSQDFTFFERTSYWDVLRRLEEAKVVYLGEIHDRRDVHELQLRIIRDLHGRGKKLVILMEAFQQQFQEAIDDYLRGRISEEEMLERSEYKKRWGFDPELYAPIWRFAKEKGIPVFALSIPSELLKEVKDEDLRGVKSPYLPSKTLPIRDRHRRFLTESLKEHGGKVDGKRFFAVQQAWDSGMAQRVASLALAYPDSTLIVLVGSGHVWRGFGIPERVNYLIGEIPQAVLYVVEDEVYFLFSKDFSRESSSTNSKKEPNWRP